MPRLIWSPAALRDVQRLYRFLAGKNLDAAKRAVKAIHKNVKVLGEQPSIGRLVEDMPDAYREWLVEFGDSGYVVRYYFDGGAATILAVRHQKEVGYLPYQ